MRDYILGPEFPTDGSYFFTGIDYIESLVLEVPGMWMLMPSQKVLYLYVYDRGIVRINGNFNQMTKEDLESAVVEIRSIL